jgi:hypothetical protein
MARLKLYSPVTQDTQHLLYPLRALHSKDLELRLEFMASLIECLPFETKPAKNDFACSEGFVARRFNNDAFA